MKTTTESEKLYRAARNALIARDSIESCFSPVWFALNELASSLYLAARKAEGR